MWSVDGIWLKLDGKVVAVSACSVPYPSVVALGGWYGDPDACIKALETLVGVVPPAAELEECWQNYAEAKGVRPGEYGYLEDYHAYATGWEWGYRRARSEPEAPQGYGAFISARRDRERVRVKVAMRAGFTPQLDQIVQSQGIVIGKVTDRDIVSPKGFLSGRYVIRLQLNSYGEELFDLPRDPETDLPWGLAEENGWL